MNKRIAVYTCVTGNYDNIREPLVKEECCDYFILSDTPMTDLKCFCYLNVDEFMPNSSMSPKDKNRYAKMHPDEIFPEYDYSIYVDGSIQIVRPVSHCISNIGESGLAIHKHRERDCIYSEGIFLTWLGAVDKDVLINDIRRYMEAGLPRHFGMFECGMIVTDLKNPKAILLYREWYEEYMAGAKRDQQALIYVLWKNGLTIDVIGNLGGKYTILTNPDINWNRSAHYRG